MKGEPRQTSLHPDVLLTPSERKRLRVLQSVSGHLSWEDREDPYIEEHVTTCHRGVAELVQTALHRAVGLEKHFIVRIRSEFQDEVVLQIQGFSAGVIRGPKYRNDAAWEVYGSPLLKDGMPSVRRYESTRFTEARIERRGLDGQWRLLADTLPRKPRHAS